MQMHLNALKQNGLARILVDLASVLDLRLSYHLRSAPIIWKRIDMPVHRAIRELLRNEC